MAKVIVYSKEQCPYCRMAKDLLTAKKIAFEEVRVDLDPEKLEEMLRLSNRRTVPQIYIGDFHVGGFDDLAELDQEGKLEPLLA